MVEWTGATLLNGNEWRREDIIQYNYAAVTDHSRLPKSMASLSSPLPHFHSSAEWKEKEWAKCPQILPRTNGSDIYCLLWEII
jgi:hypothetical protein